MENQIIVCEAVTESDAAAFWEQLHTYYKLSFCKNAPLL